MSKIDENYTIFLGFPITDFIGRYLTLGMALLYILLQYISDPPQCGSLQSLYACHDEWIAVLSVLRVNMYNMPPLRKT